MIWSSNSLPIHGNQVLLRQGWKSQAWNVHSANQHSCGFNFRRWCSSSCWLHVVGNVTPFMSTSDDLCSLHVLFRQHSDISDHICRVAQDNDSAYFAQSNADGVRSPLFKCRMTLIPPTYTNPLSRSTELLVLYTTQFQYRGHKRSPPSPILNKLNLIHILSP
jgi:hypothetical protein